LNKLIYSICILSFGFIIYSCQENLPQTDQGPDIDSYVPTPYEFTVPPKFPQPKIPADNPFTVEGISLGRHLFWDPILSKDSTLACAGCHAPNLGYGDDLKTSVGVEGIAGTRNSMPLFNLAWTPQFLWDGSAATLEEQILNPVRDPIEMHLDWITATQRLKNHPTYPTMFAKAFGNCTSIDSLNTAKAIAQFLRTMVSASSKYDRVARLSELKPDPAENEFTDSQLIGFADVFNNDNPDGAHCIHCHNKPLFSVTDGYFTNNGLDPWEDPSELSDLGLGGFNGNADDIGKFKNASLRNIELTAPYMHDGRFETLEEVVDHYISGGHDSPTLDFRFKSDFLLPGGLHLQENGKENLIAFLKTLTDWDFVNDTAFHSPF